MLTESLLYKNGMSTLVDIPKSARHEDGFIFVEMESGRELSFSIAGNPHLEGQPHEKLDDIELSPFGLHWPQLDEDLSVRGIEAGEYGQNE